jgi:hypothetical protein
MNPKARRAKKSSVSVRAAVVLSSKNCKIFIEGKITGPHFLSDKIFNFTKHFALTILRVEFGHFYSG